MIACVMLAQPAHAAPSAAEKETARKLVKSGRAKQKNGDVNAAIEDFKAAHAIMNVPTTALALGIAQLAADQMVEARDTLLAVKRMPKAKREPLAFTRARAKAATLAEEIEPKIPQLELELTGAMEGADVRVRIGDLELKPDALSAPISLNPGEYEIVASVNGDERRTSTSLRESQKRVLSIDLSGLGKKAAKPGAAPSASTQGPSGTDPLVYVGFGVAGAGVLVGGVTGFMALSKASSAKDGCTDSRCPPATHDDIDSGKTLGTVSTISFAVAGVGAAIGIWGLTRGGGEKPPGSSASLWVGPSSAGLRGRF